MAFMFGSKYTYNEYYIDTLNYIDRGMYSVNIYPSVPLNVKPKV